MACLCEDGNEPPASLIGICKQIVRRVFVIIGCVRQHSTTQIKCSVSMLTVQVNVNKYALPYVLKKEKTVFTLVYVDLIFFCMNYSNFEKYLHVSFPERADVPPMSSHHKLDTRSGDNLIVAVPPLPHFCFNYFAIVPTEFLSFFFSDSCQNIMVFPLQKRIDYIQRYYEYRRSKTCIDKTSNENGVTNNRENISVSTYRNNKIVSSNVNVLVKPDINAATYKSSCNNHEQFQEFPSDSNMEISNYYKKSNSNECNHDEIDDSLQLSPMEEDSVTCNLTENYLDQNNTSDKGYTVFKDIGNNVGSQENTFLNLSFTRTLSPVDEICPLEDVHIDEATEELYTEDKEIDKNSMCNNERSDSRNESNAILRRTKSKSLENISTFSKTENLTAKYNKNSYVCYPNKKPENLPKNSRRSNSTESEIRARKSSRNLSLKPDDLSSIKCDNFLKSLKGEVCCCEDHIITISEVLSSYPATDNARDSRIVCSLVPSKEGDHNAVSAEHLERLCAHDLLRRASGYNAEGSLQLEGVCSPYDAVNKRKRKRKQKNKRRRKRSRTTDVGTLGEE
ncbi:hypothetical protein ANN_01663 [Periplaneta americana]|uniref:Uncharacterized protein n=1 Tax=Periplaneta americana TaxID=6978 RepID=A0ABQ8TXK5_PERAM|nr:hypothetical protein ANN_01663 [Periplaneta americana]